MDNFKKLNLIFGWSTWLIASFVYLSTIEPTTSFWDCGEFIATAYKLQVGHPPGAPLFLMIARFFTLFSNPETAAMMVNSLSALCSAFTILFLFWTITYFGRKLAMQSGEINNGKIWAIIGSGLVGGLAYTFSDSFWFSAVEGEVYAMSSLFTAVVFWAILKWESVAFEKHNLRWLILIAFLMGLSIGVHLLNLLAIPAIVFVYYFKKFKPSRKGIAIAALVSVIVLGFIQYGIIPGMIYLASKFELLFVNSFGLPFNSGFSFYLLLVIALVVYGIHYTHKKRMVIPNTIILCIMAIILGYSSYAMIVIRSSANPPMDENNPENVFTLLSYLNREQYGDNPLFNGQSFNSPLDRSDPYKDVSPTYFMDEENGRYIIVDDGKNAKPNYDERFLSLIPRMWSQEQKHIPHYKNWSNFEGKPIRYQHPNGEMEIIQTPTLGDNLAYLFNYQINWMYLRYFMWNFSGRQNDIQGHGNIMHGNWITGIGFLDKMRLGNQDQLPGFITDNPANNKYYMLPFILGMIGLFFHFKKDKSDASIVMLLFFFTGIAIVLYLNQYPLQPRERDYAYSGSFYAFAIWIGMGVYALCDLFNNKLSGKLSAILATALCLLLVPGIMAKENWDDHDRSDRYTARDFAKNYLDSCAPNAILFTNGDNDTFPVWYVQEVEEYRTDVRVVNLSLLNMDWYINQLRMKAYDSEPVKLTLGEKKIRQGTNTFLPILDREQLQGNINIDDIIKFIASDNPQTKAALGSGEKVDYFPTNKLKLEVNKSKILALGIVSAENADKIVDEVTWSIGGNYVLKNNLTVLDILASNDWERPIYFASTTGIDSYVGLEDYFRFEGMAYRLVPVKSAGDENSSGQPGFVNTDILYKHLMEDFHWGNMDSHDIYMDETNRRMVMSIRIAFSRLAENLIEENKTEKARKVLDKAFEIMPESTVPYDYFVMFLAENYYKIGDDDKANKITERLVEIYEDELMYYRSLEPEYAKSVRRDQQQAMAILNRLMINVTQIYPQGEFGEQIRQRVSPLINQGAG